MTARISTYLRRLATLLAAAATFSISAFGGSASACAAPIEWDLNLYDECMAYALAQYQTGEMTFQEYNSNVNTCCWQSGGVVSETQLCVAPAGEEASEAERQPAPWEGDMTLWPEGQVLPPAGPAAPPPSEAVLAP
jgi:hypothetical protein